MNNKDPYITIRDDGMYPSKTFLLELIKQVIGHDLTVEAEDVIYNNINFSNAKQALDYLLQNIGGGSVNADDIFYNNPSFSNVEDALNYLFNQINSANSAEDIDYQDSNVKNALDDLYNSLNTLMSHLNLPLTADQINFNDTTVYNKLNELDSAIGTGTGTSVNGAVFITDIRPQNSDNNVGDKVFDDTGNVLISCTSDTDLITVDIMAITGNTHLKPVIMINNQQVPMTGTSDFPKFTGSIDINLMGNNSLTAIHEDGAKFTTSIIREQRPQITQLNFVNGYPNGQTELKEGDTFDLYVKCDSSITKIEVDNESACKYSIFNVNNLTEETVTVNIADRGDVATLRYAKVRVQKDSGSWSRWYQTDEFGNLEGKYLAMCNNLYPAVSIDSIDYPGTTNALDNDESATVNHTITKFDSVVYSSPNSQLSIANPAVYEPAKVVTRIAGDYNFAMNNFSISATRSANNATTVVFDVVNIDNTENSITISTATARLRCSQSGMSHTVTVISNKGLSSAPVVNTPVGSWASDFTGGPTVWTADLIIKDSDSKGSYNFTLQSATTTSGQEVNAFTGDTSFEVGGFVSRSITFSTPYGRFEPIGTSVTDTTKLNCIALGGTEFTYQNSKDFTDYTFTIVDANENLDPAGSYIYITHPDWEALNTSGTAYVELEEQV